MVILFGSLALVQVNQFEWKSQPVQTLGDGFMSRQVYRLYRGACGAEGDIQARPFVGSCSCPALHDDQSTLEPGILGSLGLKDHKASDFLHLICHSAVPGTMSDLGDLAPKAPTNWLGDRPCG